ncbi:MAG: DUF2845 domain-containing protein [Syntrophales bacterium]
MGTIAAALGMAAFLIVALGGDALAFRCGSGLVRAGDTTGKVLMECGPPTYKEGAGTKTKAKSVKTEKARDRTAERKVSRGAGRKVERWFYNCGESDFLYVLTFAGGVLEKEETQGYGKGKSDCLGRK